MRLWRMNMFGAEGRTGSELDVLIPDGPNDPVDVRAVARHALVSSADETVLITGVSSTGRSFGYRVFGARGETPFTTHSLAGAAAAVVASGGITSGNFTALTAAGRQAVWSDGTNIRVEIKGPFVSKPAEVPKQVRAARGVWTRLAGSGQGLLLHYVEDDPRTLPVPDLTAMGSLGLTNLTYVRLARGREHTQARVFAPGFGIPQDAGCLPAAAAIAAEALSDDSAPKTVLVRQLSNRDTVSEFKCETSAADGHHALTVASRVLTTGTAPFLVGRSGTDLSPFDGS